MRRRRSRFVEQAAACAIAAAAMLAEERAAHAQACCVAPSTTGLGRLATYEKALGGVEARGAATYASFDADGRLSRTPAGSHDVALEQNVFATARLLTRAQATAVVPFVETFRASRGASSTGGGLGDLRLALRWDVVYAEDARPLPGLAVLGGVTMPTGTAPEQATRALATDATGTGTTQTWAGLALEQTRGPWLVAASGIVTVRTDREIQGITSSLPPRLSAGLIGAHVWRSGLVLSLGASYAFEGDAAVDGVRVAGSARRALALTTALQAPLIEGTRLVTGASVVPPIAGVSAGEGASAALSLALVVPWT